jgi:hypothetical protein
MGGFPIWSGALYPQPALRRKFSSGKPCVGRVSSADRVG